MEFIQIEVKEREECGTAAVRRLRRAGHVPANLYGLSRRNLSLSIPSRELERFIRTGSHLLELKMGGETRDAIVREVQQDPLNEEILHVDLQRVDKDVSVEDQVRVVYKGIAIGTTQGGLFQGLLDTLRVSARPRDLPDEIVLDVASMVVGDGIYVRDVAALPGVTFLDAPDDLVAHVVAMRGLDEDDEEGATPVDGVVPAEGEEAETAASE